jgi:hypothetical protein
MNNTLIGPFFIEGNLNSNSFLRLLQEQIIPQIQNLNANDVWFQMDGAPPHSTAMITRYLKMKFLGNVGLEDLGQQLGHLGHQICPQMTSFFRGI